MSHSISQKKVNMADKPLKVEQLFLESSIEIAKLVYDHCQIFSRHQIYRIGDNFSCSRNFKAGDFQQTEP